MCDEGLALRQRPEWLRSAVEQYGRTLIDLPDNAFDLTQLGPITARPGSWWFVQPLWTEEEGWSDLDLIGGVTRTEADWQVYLDDVHVQ